MPCRKGGGGRGVRPRCRCVAAPIRPEGVAVDPDREPVVLQGAATTVEAFDRSANEQEPRQVTTSPARDTLLNVQANSSAAMPSGAKPHGPVDRPALARIGRPIPDDRAPAREGRRAGEHGDDGDEGAAAEGGVQGHEGLGPGRRDRVTVRPRRCEFLTRTAQMPAFRPIGTQENDSHRPSDGGESHNRAVFSLLDKASRGKPAGRLGPASISVRIAQRRYDRPSIIRSEKEEWWARRTRTYNQTVMSGRL